MEYSHLFEDLEDDSLDQFLAVAMTLLFEKVHHVACVGLMLHQHHRVYGFEDFDERRDVVGFEVMEISDFILHQFDTSSLVFHLSLVVGLQSDHSVIEDMLSFVNNTKVAVTEDSLDTVMLFEVGQDA